MGVSNSGKLKGIKITYYNDSGFAASEATYNGLWPWIDNAYACANWDLSAIAVKTNTPQNTSARSPDSLPAIFITESMMEHVAKELGMDPTELRRVNLYSVGQVRKEAVCYCRFCLLHHVGCFQDQAPNDKIKESLCISSIL